MLRRLQYAWNAFWNYDELTTTTIHQLSHVNVTSVDGGFVMSFVAIDKVTKMNIWFTKQEFYDYIVRQYAAVRLQGKFNGENRGGNRAD